jgi:hypothetical protein
VEEQSAGPIFRQLGEERGEGRLPLRVEQIVPGHHMAEEHPGGGSLQNLPLHPVDALRHSRDPVPLGEEIGEGLGGVVRVI